MSIERLVARGDWWQLHRPERFYRAVGCTLQSARSVELPISGAVLPAGGVVATLEGRVENIVYWTRMGEALPRTGGEQRSARLENAVRGFVPDGILVRCSVVGESEESFRIMSRFIPELLSAVRKNSRPALIGTELAREFARQRTA